MIQSLIVLLAFSLAVFYVARLIYRSFQAKDACATGCGKCGAIDFKKLEQQLKEKGI